MKNDELDVMLPSKIVTALDQSCVRFLMFWIEQARIAEAEWKARQLKSPLIRR